MADNTFTPARIADLRALAEKATPGPWLQHLVDDTIVIDRFSAEIAHTFPEGGEDDDVDFATDTEQRERDAAFIAAARTELPAALDEIERLRAENEKLRARKYSSAVTDIAAERARQRDDEGWTPEHDDKHDAGTLAQAAACYALNVAGFERVISDIWPWAPSWWKPTTPRRDLVKAGALIVAEIERYDRAALRGKEEA